ncbi:trimeric intracellular cation channel family protein [Arthrobacter sp.]|uniref:trimeric intracellular cation channel family protein n=1 Tax=Arthrobacter sp. TaxID=1667 RepID=UPI003A948C03
MLLLDLLGVFFFAVSGSLLAARRDFDVVGSIMLASLVGLGGGVIRDLVIDQGPPNAFSQPLYIIPPVLATLAVYLHVFGVRRLRRTLMLFDAGGLALFCVTGTVTALESGMGAISAALLGLTTAVGGGVMRDAVANEVPQVFNPRGVYAIGALCGAALTALLWHFDVLNPVTGTVVAALVFTTRVLSLRYGWTVPLASGRTGSAGLP